MLKSTAFQQYLEEMLPQVKLNEEPTKFKIIIEEHMCGVFEVEAIDIEEAMKMAQDKYKMGEFVVKHDDCSTALMMAEDELTGETTEWEEF